MTDRMIETAEDVAEGAAWLAGRDPKLAEALAKIGEAPLRRTGDGFAALLRIIVGQQVSTTAAAGIWRRIEEAGLAQASAVIAASEDTLLAAGLSRPKARYARALAEADLDYSALRAKPVEAAIAELVAIKGVGQWTAEIYLMFAVGRADVFAPGDLALREAVRVLYGLGDRPSIKELRRMSEAWSPWRGVAARLLFAYYRVIKGREGV